MPLIGLVAFGTVVLLAMLVLHSYLWWRLVGSTTRAGGGGAALTALTLVLALLPALAVGLRGDPAADDAAAPAGLGRLQLARHRLLRLPRPARPGAGALGGPPRRVAGRPAARRACSRRRGTPAHPRRVFLARSLAVTAGAIALGTAGTGAYIANSAPVVRRVPITLRRLDPALDGLRIVTFSDAHLSATYGGRRFERLVEIVNGQRPDVVAIVGDLVDGSVEELREDVAPLADLVSEQGVYFVTGNHEYFVDTRRLAAAPAHAGRARAAQRTGADRARGGDASTWPASTTGRRRARGCRARARIWTRRWTAGTTAGPSSCWRTNR